MRRFTLTTLTALVFTFALGAVTARSGPPDAGADLRRLVSWMTGSFSSEQLAASDTSLLDIRLHLVEVWPERQDAFWIYVEQAMADAPDRPYRQRVYRVAQLDDSTFESSVFTFEFPHRFAGRWQEDKPLEPLTADSLTETAGCSIFFKMDGDSTFAGSTAESACRSNVRGAAYIISEVLVRPDRLITWDRGFYSNDEQAWGALTNGYEFKRVSDGGR